jgi:hypothetical protein
LRGAARSSSSSRPRIERIDVDRQPALAPQVIPHVLVAGYDEFVGQAEARGQCVDEALRVVGRACGSRSSANSDGSCHTGGVGAPVDRQRPARQLLAGIPLALAEMQEAAGAYSARRRLHQLGRVAARLVGPSASVFHSAPSRSSIDTKVGSPPCVRRTSPAVSARSTCAPSVRGVHCVSV